MNSTCRVEFKGHTKAVVSLKYSRGGETLISGSQDTHVVVWDVVSETGRVRLKGHKNAVTGDTVLFL
jgi:U3 small nucleolar RNA-associated protein 12